MRTRDSARVLRQNQTPEERRLWAALRRRQIGRYRFRRQVVIGKFIADFYCPEVRLVEVDGSVQATPE